MCRVTAENYNPPLKDFISQVNRNKRKSDPVTGPVWPTGWVEV